MGVVLGLGQVFAKEADMDTVDLWKLANEKKDTFRFSTLFTAQNVRDLLSDEEGLKKSIDWCKQTGVTRVFVESFRSAYTAERKTLERVKAAYLEAGFEVSGCVTTTNVGKRSTGWELIDCYTDVPTQEHLQEIFEYTASIFDEIMIDDFWFTDCECAECAAAKGDRSWADYRCDLMVRVSRERILKPAKVTNPGVKVIIKYPQWYDNFHNRGYEVVRQTADFDKIWIGTETRDPDSKQWGRKAQYEAFFIMHWLSGIGGDKTGGGWFDPYGCSPETYVEQARQTILGQAKEAVLFCYGSLIEHNGPANVERLRSEIPGLFDLAAIVHGKSIKGISAPKPPNSDGLDEEYVFDFVGMLGLPLVPNAEISDAPAIFLSAHALKDPDLADKVRRMKDSGRRLLITDGLSDRLRGKVDLDSDHLQVLKVGGEPRSILELDRAVLREIRSEMLAPLGIAFDAPSRVALYLMGEDIVAIENFNDEKVDVQLSVSGLSHADVRMTLPPGGVTESRMSGSLAKLTIGSRSLVVLTVSVAPAR